jgi:hypothetical protein
MGWKNKWYGEINMEESRAGDKNKTYNGEEKRNEVQYYL